MDITTQTEYHAHTKRTTQPPRAVRGTKFIDAVCGTSSINRQERMLLPKSHIGDTSAIPIHHTVHMLSIWAWPLPLDKIPRAVTTLPWPETAVTSPVELQIMSWPSVIQPVSPVLPQCNTCVTPPQWIIATRTPHTVSLPRPPKWYQ